MRNTYFISLIFAFVSYSCDRSNPHQQADGAKPETGQVEHMKTFHPERKKVQLMIPVDGVITYDPSEFENVSSRYMGRIEKLFVKYKNQPVTKGQKLFDIYCPDMMTGQSDLLYLMKNDPGNRDLINQARQKLILLGLTESQMEAIIKSGQPDYILNIYSPVSGFTVDIENPSAQAQQDQNPGGSASSSPMGGPAPAAMTSSVSPAPKTMANELEVREGMYIRQGQTLFRIVKGNHLWGLFKLNPDKVQFLARGQPVDISTECGTYHGKIDLIEPVIRNGDKTITIRVLIDNHEALFKVGQLINGRISGNTVGGIWIPRSAITGLGEKNIVFVKTGDSIQPRHILTGITYNNEVLVYSGVDEQDNVVADSQYLYDNDTFIKTGKFNVKQRTK